MGRQLTNAASRTEDDTGLARLRRGLGQAGTPHTRLPHPRRPSGGQYSHRTAPNDSGDSGKPGGVARQLQSPPGAECMDVAAYTLLCVGCHIHTYGRIPAARRGCLAGPQ